MRRATALALAMLLALAVAPVTTARPPADAVGTAADAAADAGAAGVRLSAAGRYIVVLRDGASVDVAARHAKGHGVAADRTFRAAIHGYAARMTRSQVAAVRADPAVAEVVPDEIISMTGQSVPRGVKRVGGRDSLIAGIDGVDQDGKRVDADIAIVDTGIGDAALTPPSHEDLNIAGGYNCYDSKPDDGLPPNRTRWGDQNGHGTHVAGTVGAIDNGIGVVGVAPGVRLWAVRILNPAGDGLLSWYVCGLDWIASQRDPADATRPLIEAVNMSVAKSGADDNNCGYTNKDVMHQAICRVVAAGIPVVAAAGNNSFSASRLRPASYNEVITVSALADTDGQPGGLGGNLCHSWSSWDQDDTFADFSNYGRDIDLIAPGKCTYSTLPGNRYGWVSGTSMAAPLVTGAIALYRASRPAATVGQVKAALIAAGNLDWNTATDPDSMHEPLLDVSHIVDLGDFTVDATPGRSRDALVGRPGAVFDLPVKVVRAEDFGARVTLSATAEAPLAAGLAQPVLEGLDATDASMTVTVPDATPSGNYTVQVTADDGARIRSSAYVVHVDSDVPVAVAPVSLVVTSSRLSGSSISVRHAWAGASDAAGGVTAYRARWVVDGVTGPALAVSPATRSATRALAAGHTYALEVQAGDAAANWSEWARGPLLGARVTQDTSPTLVRTGTWRRYLSSAMSGGSTIYAKARGASIAHAFTGRGISLIAPKGPSRGRAAIWIDGVSAGSVGLWSSTLKPRAVVFSRTWTTSGPHTLKIVVAGTAGHPRVDVDAFVVIR